MTDNDTVQQDQPPSLHTTANRSHALVIGGTGMLREISLSLATQYETVSVIARNSNRLNDLWEEALQQGLRINPLQLDYKETDHLAQCLQEMQQEFGPADLVVAWVKRHAEASNAIIAKHLSRQGNTVDYYDVMGSLHYKDFFIDEDYRLSQFNSYPTIRYHRVKLGQQYDAAESEVRWLTNEEITAGVMQAIGQQAAQFIIGDKNLSAH